MADVLAIPSEAGGWLACVDGECLPMNDKQHRSVKEGGLTEAREALKKLHKGHPWPKQDVEKVRTDMRGEPFRVTKNLSHGKHPTTVGVHEVEVNGRTWSFDMAKHPDGWFDGAWEGGKGPPGHPFQKRQFGSSDEVLDAVETWCGNKPELVHTPTKKP